jgi:uncharacterized protein YaiI (UPF0178 family)
MTIDTTALGNLVDDVGLAGEIVGKLSDAADDRGELARVNRMMSRLIDQMRFQHEVLAEIHELSDPNSRTPHQDMQMIRIKAAVALRSAAQSGVLS